ncbi:MAG: type II 3-dehydroquinate dehydratase [Aliifodinibius sp.]|nr:type II 3-dehydroquinate dehydratase [Fodinibius sp.]NIV10992.1 type II 3-dehydroquinate dehydratase [Fodinibius sp.]NIY24589.1 type II 3-dehydroquinate dehydratase [Fodinibius sp.]
MKISVLNGPNLNMLGKRDPKQYGSATLEDIEKLLIDSFPDHEMTFFQSNLEGELVEAIQSLLASDFDGVIVNFGGFSHTSVAIRDALELIDIPIVEVHLSNIHAREEFRERTLTGAVANGIITGFGKQSYLLGVHALEKLIASK